MQKSTRKAKNNPKPESKRTAAKKASARKADPKRAKAKKPKQTRKKPPTEVSSFDGRSEVTWDRLRVATHKKKGVGNEIAGILVLLLGAVLFLSLTSFEPSDIDSATDHNLIGPVGAHLADILLHLFGLGSFFFSGVVILLGAMMIFGRRLEMKPSELVGQLLIVMGGAVLFHMLFDGDTIMGHMPGGAVGAVVGETLRSLFNDMGTYIICLGCALLGIVLVTDLSFAAILRGLVRFARECGHAIAAPIKSIANRLRRDETDEDQDEEEQDDHDLDASEARGPSLFARLRARFARAKTSDADASPAEAPPQSRAERDRERFENARAAAARNKSAKARGERHASPKEARRPKKNPARRRRRANPRPQPPEVVQPAAVSDDVLSNAPTRPVDRELAAASEFDDRGIGALLAKLPNMARKAVEESRREEVPRAVEPSYEFESIVPPEAIADGRVLAGWKPSVIRRREAAETLKRAQRNAQRRSPTSQPDVPSDAGHHDLKTPVARPRQVAQPAAAQRAAASSGAGLASAGGDPTPPQRPVANARARQAMGAEPRPRYQPPEQASTPKRVVGTRRGAQQALARDAANTDHSVQDIDVDAVEVLEQTPVPQPKAPSGAPTKAVVQPVAEAVHAEISAPVRDVDPTPVATPVVVPTPVEPTPPVAAQTPVEPHTPAATPQPMPGPAIVLSASRQPKSDRDLEAVAERKRGTDSTGFEKPPLSLLTYDPSAQVGYDSEQLKAMADTLVQKLADYRVKGEVVEICPGPVVTRFEFSPAPGTKVATIANLADDLKMALEAMSIRVIAPIPGKGVVGIEVPNEHREIVYAKEILGSENFANAKGMLTMALGKDTEGTPVVADLAKMPHLLVAGSTGSGKSVAVNTMIASLLYNATPDDVRLILVDPKRLELSVYNGIPHLLLPPITDPHKAANALRWACSEMERRYELMAELNVRNIAGYNKRIAKLQRESEGSSISAGAAGERLSNDDGSVRHSRMPFIVIIIDELADLMMVAAKEVETSIARLAQMARACGMHMILATQRPSVDVLTGLIKANFPTRISFRVFSRHDSKTVLDTSGAEGLLGMGDSLFLPPGTGQLKRVHGAFLSDEEVERVVDFLKVQGTPEYNEEILAAQESATSGGSGDDEYDEHYDAAVALVCELGQASISMIQRKLRVGYNRAARMVEMMEREGIVGPADGSKPRAVLVGNH